MYDYDAQEQANKTALILVQEKYSERLAAFVKGSKTRLAYAATELNNLIEEAVDDTGAEFDYVRARFDAYLADTVLDNPPPHEDLSYKTNDDGVPPVRYEVGDPLEGEVQKSDVQDLGEVDGLGHDESAEPDARVDLGGQSADSGDGEATEPNIPNRSSCFRCGKELDSHVASVSPVCKDCTSELHKLALGYGGDLQGGGIGNQEPPLADNVSPFDRSDSRDNAGYVCSVCGYPNKEGASEDDPNRGTREDVERHVMDHHADAVNRKQQEMWGTDTAVYPGQGQQTSKVADVPDQGDPDKSVEVAPQQATPADNFDDDVQDLAERAAATQFSTATEHDVHSIASQLGIPEDEVRHALVITSLFGNYVGSNGTLAETGDAPQGYQEVSVDGGGNVKNEALVPVDAVVNHVANRMNMEPDLVYNMVKDRYGGADMPDKYHASVSGERHFYLPSELAGQAQQQAQPQDPNVGPTAPPAPAAQAPTQQY